MRPIRTFLAGLVISLLFMPLAYASSNCLSASLSFQNPNAQYYTTGKLAITNSCNTTQSLNGVPLSFISSDVAQPAVAVQGEQAMWGGANSSTTFTYQQTEQGNLASTTLNGSVPAKATVNLTLGINLNSTGIAFDGSKAQGSLIIGSGPAPKNNGEIDITVDPTGVNSNSAPAEIKVQDSTTSKIYTVSVTDWKNPTHYALKQLPYDSYSIVAPVINGISGQANPSQVSINSATPQTVAVSYQAQPTNCLSGSLKPGASDTGWYAQPTLTITNNCASAQKLAGLKVSFTSQDIQQHPVVESSAMWGWPYGSSTFTNSGNQAAVVLTGADPLAVGGTATLGFGVTLKGADFDIANAGKSLRIGGSSPIPINNGEIDLTINPAGVENKSQTGEVDIYNSTSQEPYRVIRVTDWNQVTQQKILGLPYDSSYKIAVNSVDDGNTLGYAAPASFALNSATPQAVNVTYQPKPATGTLKLELGNAPMVNAQSEVKVTIEDDATKQNWVENLSWNSAANVALPAGAVHQYTVTAPIVTNGRQTAAPQTVWHPVITKNATTPLQLSFLPPVNNLTQNVSFNVSGLPSGTTASLIIADDYNNKFSQDSLKNGEKAVPLPVNDTFHVNAVAAGLSVTVNPSTFSLMANNQPPVVQVQFSTQPVVQATFQAYADSGTQSQYDSGQVSAISRGLVPPQGGSLTEGFGLWNNPNPGPGHTDLWAISGAFGGTPTPTSNYLRAHAQENKAFLSIGGEAPGDGYPWDKESVADAVKDIEWLVNYYHYEGVDFDFEGAAIGKVENQKWIGAVAYRLRQDNPNLLLSLTVADYVIYQDNSDVNHIYAYGPEVTATIEDTWNMEPGRPKMVFNFINKMAFDLGDQAHNHCSQTTSDMGNHPYVLPNGDTYSLGNNCLIMSAQAADIQLARMLNIPTSQAWQYVGEVFMPIVDDGGVPLTYSLAGEVATKLHELGVNHMGYWNVQRDYNFNPGLEFGNQFTKILGLSK